MNKIILFFIFIIFVSGCSFNKNSKFWTASKNIIEENNQNYKKVFAEEEALSQELNSSLIIKLDKSINNNETAIKPIIVTINDLITISL